MFQSPAADWASFASLHPSPFAASSGPESDGADLKLDVEAPFQPRSQMQTIPLYSSDMSLLRHISVDDASLLGKRVNLHRNRRGHLKMAVLKDVSSDYVRRHNGKRGHHFDQELPSGRIVHALQGVRGSR